MKFFINDNLGAIADQRTAISLDPNLGAAYAYLARFGDDEPDKKITYARKAVELNPNDPESHVALSITLRETGRLDESLSAGRAAILFNPNDALVHTIVRKIAELVPESATAQTHLSRELQKQGLLEEVFVACRTAIELAPTSSEPYEQLASLFQAQGIADDVAAYSKVLESYPNNARAINGFAWTLVTTPDLDGEYRHLDVAAQWVQTACDLQPESGAIWNTLAVAQYRLGQCQATITAIQKSQQLGYAEEPSNWLFLALAHWQLGNQEQAARAYGKAISARQQTETDQELLTFFTEARNVLGRTGLEQILALTPNNSEVAAELANLVLDSNPVDWTVLTPQEMKSAGGATLTLLDDDSILASGTNAPRDQYHLEFVVSADIDLRSVRLEALTDPSLPANGPGRDTKGFFVLKQWQLTATPKEGGEPTTLKFDAAVADYQYRDYPIRPNGWWSINGGQSSSRVAIWQSADSQHLTQGMTLNLRLDFDLNERVTNLGRFRLSVTDAPFAYENGSVLIAGMKLTDPWAKLAVAYHLIEDQQALDQLLEQHTEAAVGFGDMHLANQEWQQAIDVYDSLITDDTTDPNLLNHRAQAHAALEQWDDARSDWLRAVGENPALNPTVFETFRQANRVREAAEFGLRAIHQKPDDAALWERLAPALLLTENEAAWREQSARVVRQWAGTTDANLAWKVWRACLLTPGGVNLEELPEQVLIVPADTTLNAKQLTEIWTTRALLAYRRGDAKAALEYTKKSQDLGPWSGTRAINLAVQALAQHELEELDNAIETLERAQNQFTASPSYAESSRAWPHTAEVLLRVAEAKIKPLSIEELNQALSTEPTNATLLVQRAKHHFAAENWELAKTDWLRAIEQQPSLAEKRLSRIRAGIALSRSGSVRLALPQRECRSGTSVRCEVRRAQTA